MVGELNFAILDPNTPAKTAASFDVGGAYMEGQQNALARQGARQTQQMNALSLQKAQNAMADEATMKGVYARGGDIGAGLQGAGFGKEALDYKTKMQTSETATLTQQKLKIEALQKGIETTAQLMSGANDQASWSAMKQAAAQHLPPEAIANIPDRFDPALRDDLVMKSLPVKDQLANQWKALDQQLRQDEFSYRQQNDAANRGVAIRGQNLADARGKEGVTHFTPDAVENAAFRYNMDGTLPPMGIGKAAAEAKTAILNRAAELAKEEGVSGPDQRAEHFKNKAIASSIQQQEKQLGAMGSFVKNLDMQIDKVDTLAKDLKTFDARILNVPLRAVRGKLAGNAQQAKYDMYLTEIESEIGKLATGATGSVAELSASAQEKWAKIHDKNLSINDMRELLKETKAAGHLRLKSVEDTISETRARLKRTKPADKSKTPTVSNW